MAQDNRTVDSLIASERFQNYCLYPTKKETVHWDNWLKECPEHQAIMKEAKAIVLSLAMELSQEEIHQEFLAFKKKIDKQKTPATKLVALSSKSKPMPRRRLWLGAVALGLLVATVFGTVQYFTTFEPTAIGIVTDYGEIKTQILPDGSKVILNANSALHFIENWTETTSRIVQLKGEAFFEITRQDTNNDFIVQTPKGAIKVLGTSFNVVQRKEILEVALLEGEVALLIPNQPERYMKPGEMVVLNTDQTITQIEADVDASSAWRFQRMVFKGVSIEKITQRLLVEFDIQVEVKNQALLQRKINANIPKNDPELLLQALSELYDVKVKKINDKRFLIE